ncbi:MAG: ester cyclase, partial [Aliifodinibius sp.]|nr:ester cyclase [Fodinibius sp.]NIY28220.1 ester cyclase [Fodinibius sp.]
GNEVCVRVTETATHTNEYRGIAPTGNKLNYVVMMIWRISDSKIVEGWIVYDQLGFLQQIGVPFAQI